MRVVDADALLACAASCESCLRPAKEAETAFPLTPRRRSTGFKGTGDTIDLRQATKQAALISGSGCRLRFARHHRTDQGTPIHGGHAMLRYVFIILAAFVLVGASLVPDDAFARRGGGGGGFRGGGGGGFRGGGGGFHGAYRGGGARFAGGGHRYAGGPRPSHPIAGRPGYPGRPIAGRPGYPGRPIAGRPGYPGRPVAGYPGYPGWRGAAYGAAAVGAAAATAGAYGYYNNYNNSGCYQDSYGNYVCPYQNQYQYQYRY
jgi:hypothetical protein